MTFLPVATYSWRLSRVLYLYFKVRPDRHFTNKKLHTLVFFSSSNGTIKLLILSFENNIFQFFKQIVKEL